MSTKTNDGGPAFPSVRTEHFIDGAEETLTNSAATLRSVGGMTLRDWFAGQALAGYLSTNFENCAAEDAKLAHWSYQLADAMLAVRQPKDAP